MAILRLWSGVKYNNQLVMYDYTFWLSEVLIFSCLEVDFAIVCASIPIFWPGVVAVWDQIYVTQEVIVTVEAREGDDKGDMEMARISSIKSRESTEGLVGDGMEDLSALKVVQIQALKETERMSWGGTALKN